MIFLLCAPHRPPSRARCRAATTASIITPNARRYRGDDSRDVHPRREPRRQEREHLGNRERDFRDGSRDLGRERIKRERSPVRHDRGLPRGGGAPPRGGGPHGGRGAARGGRGKDPRDDIITTVYIHGLPADVKERELRNLLRFLPLFQVWSTPPPPPANAHLHPRTSHQRGGGGQALRVCPLLPHLRNMRPRVPQGCYLNSRGDDRGALGFAKFATQPAALEAVACAPPAAPRGAAAAEQGASCAKALRSAVGVWPSAAHRPFRARACRAQACLNGMPFDITLPDRVLRASLSKRNMVPH